MDGVTELTVTASCQAILANLAILARVLAKRELSPYWHYWFKEEYDRVMGEAQALSDEVDRLYYEDGRQAQ